MLSVLYHNSLATQDFRTQGTIENTKPPDCCVGQSLLPHSHYFRTVYGQSNGVLCCLQSDDVTPLFSHNILR